MDHQKFPTSEKKHLDGHCGYSTSEEYYAVEDMNALQEWHGYMTSMAERMPHSFSKPSAIGQTRCGGRTMNFDGICETGRVFEGVGFHYTEKGTRPEFVTIMVLNK